MAATVVGCAWLATRTTSAADDVVQVVSLQPPSRAAVTNAPVTIAAAPSEVPHADHAATSAALMREFVTTPDLHAFAMRARQRPAEGGLFYAMAAVDWCGLAQPRARSILDDGVAAEVARTGTVSNKRLALIDRTLRRCDGFVPGETEMLHRSLDAESADRSDPLLTVLTDLRAARKSGDVDAAIGAAKRLLDTHDPLFVSAHVYRLASLDRIGNPSPGGLWFDGYDYRPSPDDESVYTVAIQLAGCVAGQPCDGDQYVRMSCLGASDFCPDTPADLYFNHPEATLRPTGFDRRVAELVERMNSAIERSDVKAFLAPGR